MSASDAAKRGSQGTVPPVSVPLGARLKAWWHGYDLQVRRKPMALESGPHGVGYEADLAPWERAALAVPQLIWGEGFLTPGGADRAAQAIKPLGLDESMSVLDIGAGLGGQARLIARQAGAYVTAIEADRELAEVAQAMSEKAGLAKKAKVHPFDPAHVEFRPRSFDVAVSTDAFYRIEPKEALLAAVSDALKGRAQIHLFDYVVDEAVGESEELAAWRAVEPAAVHLWSEREYRKCFNDLRFDVRVCADVTADQRRTVVGGFAGYLNAAGRSGVEERLKETLVGEVERWTRLVAALDSGALKAVRLYAHRAQRESLMSDW